MATTEEILRGNRVEEYIYHLVDFKGNFIRALRNTEGGSINFDCEQSIQSAGQINFTRPEARDQVDWLKCRVKIYYSLQGLEPWSLGVFVPSVPEDDHGEGIVRNGVILQDKLILLDTDRVGATYYIKRNDSLQSHVVSLIESIGEVSSGVQPSTVTAREELAWDGGTPKLTIINDILKAMGFYPLYVNGNGIYQAKPYILPSQITPIRHFKRGDQSIHKANYRRSINTSEIPNKVILTADGSTTNDALTEYWENRDPDSPYSIENRGQTITYFEDGVEAESPTQLKALAQRKLVELTSPSTVMNIEHLVVPLGLHDIISFESGEVNEKALEVRRMEYSLTPGSTCKTVLNGVVDV